MNEQIQVNESNPERRKVRWHIVQTDGITPALGEGGGQPQISINDSAFTDEGIGTLVSVGFGNYYAVLDAASVVNVGDEIVTRYKSSSTAECPGDTVDVVAFDPFFLERSVDGVISDDYYGTLTNAAEYFASRLNSSAWDDATEVDRLKALKTATRAIDLLNFAGDKAEDDQYLQFPRGSDTVVPPDIVIACYEEALKLLDGADPDTEIANLGTISQGFSSVRKTYDRTVAVEHVRAGIVSPLAWSRLRPFLRDPNEIKISRVS